MDVSTEKGTEEGKGTGPSSISGYYGCTHPGNKVQVLLNTNLGAFFFMFTIKMPPCSLDWWSLYEKLLKKMFKEIRNTMEAS